MELGRSDEACKSVGDVRTSRLAGLTYPDGTIVNYTHDALGRTSEVRSGSTVYGSFSYFADDLPEDVAFGNQVVRSVAYNGRGWPTSIRASYGATTFLDLLYSGYDASGNVLAVGGTTQGAESFAYDGLDRLKTASGPFGVQDFTYDALGNRLSLSTFVLRPNGAGSSAQWARVGCSANWQCVDEVTADGSASYVTTGTNGRKDLYALSNLPISGTIESVTVSALAWGEADDSGCLDPPPCHVIPARVQPLVRTGGTTYAGSAQTILSSNPDAPALVQYTWWANPRTAQNWTKADVDALEAGMSKYAGLETAVTQLSVTVKFAGWGTYAYGNGPTGTNMLTSATKNGGTTTFAYDVSGNLASKTGGWTYEWTNENLLSRALVGGVQQQAYVYDALGRRVRAYGADESTWTISILSGQDVIHEKTDSGAVTKYVHANGMRIARIAPSGAVEYYLGDHLGSTRKVLDASRNTVFSTSYEPFGKPVASSGSEAYKYTSEKHDDPTGLVYLRARQYDPDVGRFVSADPVLGSLGMPQTLNRYPYVVNNPLKYTDPTGEIAPTIVAISHLGACGRYRRGRPHILVPDIASAHVDPIMLATGWIPLWGDVLVGPSFATRLIMLSDFASCDTQTSGPKSVRVSSSVKAVETGLQSRLRNWSSSIPACRRMRLTVFRPRDPWKATIRKSVRSG